MLSKTSFFSYSPESLKLKGLCIPSVSVGGGGGGVSGNSAGSKDSLKQINRPTTTLSSFVGVCANTKFSIPFNADDGTKPRSTRYCRARSNCAQISKSWGAVDSSLGSPLVKHSTPGAGFTGSTPSQSSLGVVRL